MLRCERPAPAQTAAAAAHGRADVRQLPGLEPGTRFEQVFHQDFRHCACAMPMLSKKWNDALGTFVAVRLCCLARAVEQLTGRRLYEVYDFDPRWVWDCDGLHQRVSESEDGTVEMVRRGPPPRWLLKRFLQKGVEVRNLPAGLRAELEAEIAAGPPVDVEPTAGAAVSPLP